MICPCFAPFREKLREKRVNNLLVVSFSVIREFPEFVADLYEDGNLRGEGPIYCFGVRSDVGGANLLEINFTDYTWSPETYLPPSDKDVEYLGSDTTYEGHLLVNMYTLAVKMFSQSPHIAAAEVLVLEADLDIFRSVDELIDLSEGGV